MKALNQLHLHSVIKSYDRLAGLQYFMCSLEACLNIHWSQIGFSQQFRRYKPAHEVLERTDVGELFKF